MVNLPIPEASSEKNLSFSLKYKENREAFDAEFKKCAATTKKISEKHNLTYLIPIFKLIGRNFSISVSGEFFSCFNFPNFKFRLKEIVYSIAISDFAVIY